MAIVTAFQKVPDICHIAHSDHSRINPNQFSWSFHSWRMIYIIYKIFKIRLFMKYVMLAEMCIRGFLMGAGIIGQDKLRSAIINFLWCSNVSRKTCGFIITHTTVTWGVSPAVHGLKMLRILSSSELRIRHVWKLISVTPRPLDAGVYDFKYKTRNSISTTAINFQLAQWFTPIQT